MKKVISLFIIIITSMSCSKNIYRITKIADINYVLENRFLLGNVKEVAHYKAAIDNSISKDSQKSIISSITSYTRFGKIKEKREFDKFGKLELQINNYYNSENKLIKFISTDTRFKISSDKLFEYDSIGNCKSSTLILNDTIEFINLFKYDSIGNMTEEIEIKGEDTNSIRKIEYKYNNQNSVLWRKSVKKEKFYNSEEEHQMQYDKFGNLKEVVDKSPKSKFFGESRTSFEFDGQNRIIKLAQYKNGKLDSEMLFDKTFNLRQLKYYEESKLLKEFKYEYKFDRQGNWIKKYIYSKNHFKGEKQFVPLSIEERQIKYFE